MRSLLAGLALLLGGLAATAASVAYVAHETVLDPDRAGTMIARALDQPELRSEILSAAVPGYDSLPATFRALVDHAATRPVVDQVLREVRLDADGTVDLSGVRDQMVQTLRTEDQPLLASRLAAIKGHDTYQLPSDVASRYAQARDTAWKVATGGAVLAALLFLAALLVSRHRRGTLGAIGLFLLASFGLTLLVYSRLTDLADRLSGDPWVHAGAAAAQAAGSEAASILLPLAVAGGALMLVSLLIPGRRRR